MIRTPALLAVAIVLASAIPGCNLIDLSGGPPPGAKSVVLVTIDTLRADHVGAYGAEGVETPTLDGLAASGVRFETAITATPITLPSHASILTGMDPPDHGVRHNGTFKLDAEVTTLAERFAAGGWATGAFVGAVVLITRGDLSAVRTLDFNRGDLWMLIAMPNWALYSVLLRRRPHNVAPMVVLTVTIAAGLAFLTPVFIFELVRGSDFRVNTETLLSVAYVALFASVIAYVCWNRGAALIGANRAGLFMHLVPVFSALLAIAILGESLEGHHLSGVALIVLGIYLTTSTRLLSFLPARGGRDTP